MHNPQEFLNAKGLELLGLKETLKQTKNGLVRTSLEAGVNALTIKKPLKTAMLDGSTVEAFLDKLLNETDFIDETNLNAVYNKHTKTLQKELDSKKIKIRFDNSVKEGIVVVKRLGAKTDFAKRRFRMTDKEFATHEASGFVDTFMLAHVLGVKRELEEDLSRFYVDTDTLEVSLGKTYHDEKTGFYNIDVRIKVVNPSLLDKRYSLEDVVKGIKKVSEKVEGIYFKRLA